MKAEGEEVHWRAVGGERGFGPSGQEEGEEGICLFIFYFHFFNSKAIFKTIIKITLNYV